MKDIAVRGGSSVTLETDRSAYVDRHAEQTVSEAGGGLARRIDDAHRQWRDGWRTAQREGWTVSLPSPLPLPRSMRCDDVDCHGGRTSRRGRLLDEPNVPDAASNTAHMPRSQIAQFFVRERRAVSVDRQAGVPDASPVTSTALPWDVVSQPVPRETRFKTAYTTAEVFRALSMCSAPFTHASQIADDLLAIAEYPTFTQEKREMLRNVAIMADQLAGMAANVFRMQSVCKVFGIVADLLEGKPMTPDDVLDVNMLSRSVMSLKRGRSPLYLKETFIRGVATRFGNKVRATIDQKKTMPKWPDSYLSTVRNGATRSQSLAVLPDIDEGQITSLELFYSEPGDRTLTAPAVEIGGEARDEDAPAKVGASLEGMADDLAGHGSEDVLDEEEAIIQRISAGMQPAAMEWTKVQSMPLRRRYGAQSQWETVPVREYAIGNIDARGRAEGEAFIDGGKTYLRLAGYAVAVRPLFPERWWIVDNHAAPLAEGHANRLPPLPLRAVVAGSTDRFAIDEPDWEDVGHAHDLPVCEDGYIRYWGRKFIDIGGKRVEASLRPIQGEEAISHFASRLLDVLPAADAMQIIRLSDGTRWIEGTHGYYRLRFDLALRDFYVEEAGDAAAGVEPRRALVDFDIDRQRWTALVGRRRSGYEDILAARYLRVEEAAEVTGPGELEDVQSPGASFSGSDARLGNPESVQSVPGQPLESDTARTSVVLPQPERAEEGDAEVYADADAPDAAGSIDDERGEALPDRHEFGPTFPLYASSQTGLEREFALFGHYAAHLKRFPFFSRANLARGHRRRILLRQALRRSMTLLQDTSMVAVNRMEPAVRVELAPRVLSLRQRLVGLYPSAEDWSRLTVQQKQQQVSHMVQLAYRESGDEMWPCLSGFCNEIADVVLSAMIHKKPKLRDHLMQIALYDQRGAKGTHVMLVYADQPAHLDVFGDRASQDIHVQRLRPTFNEADFYDWLMVNRDGVQLIDAWATNKLVDLSEATSHALVSHELMPNLMEAGFDLNGRPRFHVRAVLPRRPPNAVRPRRDVGGVRVLHSAPATWEVLAAWAVTGTLPSGASVGALRADLLAAADSAGHDATRQALLRTLAEEIMPQPRNGTEPAGIDRRVLVMAGRAAWTLLDRPMSTAPESSAAATTAITADDAVSCNTTPSNGVTRIDTTRIDTTHNAATSTTAPAFDSLASRAETMGERLAAYSPMRVAGGDGSAVQQSGSQTYVWMPGGRYYAVREIMPGRLFIVDPDNAPFGRPSLPPIPLERDGALWRIVDA